jgi:hypothetical protein
MSAVRPADVVLDPRHARPLVWRAKRARDPASGDVELLEIDLGRYDAGLGPDLPDLAHSRPRIGKPF